MAHITNIELTEKSGFFAGKEFVWNDIDNFSVLTGINGSGKTKLLDAIASADNFNSVALIRYVGIDYRPPKQKHANEIEASFSSTFRVEGEKYFYVDKQDNATDWSNAKNNFKSNNIAASLDYAIIDKMIKDRKKFQNDPAFKEEFSKIEAYKESFDLKVLLPDDPKKDQPWDRIDRILSEFGLFIRVDRMNLNAVLQFLRVDRPNKFETELEMSNLSSGEQVAFALALWTWGNSKGQMTDVLLIDEFDAHLNPSITEKFIDVIKEYFVDMGVQVIMTTHNPSTVIYAENFGAGIVWMEDGLIDHNKAQEAIIQELSNGLLNINQLAEEAQWLVKNKKHTVVFTEGKHDAQYIKTAIKVFKRADFEPIYIFACTSATTIPAFVKIPFGHTQSIALFDTDDTGKEMAKKILNDPDLQVRLKEKSLQVLHISPEDDKVVEDLFSVAVKGGRGKYALAKYLAKPANHTETNFYQFKLILDEIQRVAS